MRVPKVVLDNLASKSKTGYKFQRLYRNLYNPEFYLKAYGDIYAKQGNMTEGTDGKTIDGMSIERIKTIISKIRDESYHPNPVRRTYIPKKSGGQRPLGIPSFDDKLVQEIIKEILESIYEGSFKETSHGYRPKRSCHTAIQHITHNFSGARWWVEGDIKGFFDNIDHHILISLLRKRIQDEKFINLIWKFLKAGYMEDWKFNNSYSGTPQGGIISPILANIYLHELDSYMEEYKQKFDQGKLRKRNPEYRHFEGKIRRLKKKHAEKWDSYTKAEKETVIEELKALSVQQRSHDVTDVMDPNYKRLQYIRYADDFLIGVIGDKQDAINIKADITQFLQSKLNLALSQEKTRIVNSRKRTRFLGYDLAVLRDKSVKRDKNGVLTRSRYMTVVPYMPIDKVRDKMLELKVLKIDKTGKWKPIHRPILSHIDDLEILSTYNAEIRGVI